MNSRSVVLAGAILVSVSLAAPAQAAKCELEAEAARDKFLALREAKNRANDAARASAVAIQQFGPEFKKAVEEYNASNLALKEHAGKKPAADISVPILPDRRTLENQGQVNDWEGDGNRLEAARERKMAALNAAFARLGNWHNWFTAGSGVIQMERTARDVAEVLAALEGEGNAAAQEYARLITTIVKPPAGTSDYAWSHYKSVPSNSGLMEAADTTTQAAKKARKAEVDFSNLCPYGVVVADDGATSGREEDGAEVDRNRNRNNNGNTNVNRRANGNNANNANSSEEYDDFGNLIEERNTNNPNANNANNANRANANNANNANVAANANNANNSNAPSIYTVKAGQNLTVIARELAPGLGNPPIRELVDVLYANMTTKSRNNTNLIFPLDTINLAGVKKDLARG